MTDEFKEPNTYKILLVGDSQVGKTSILHRYAEDNILISPITTIGVDFKIKSIRIKDDIARLQIWDTAGQERFRSITQSYYRGSHGIILVFDMNNLVSFEGIKEWISTIRKITTHNVKFVLVGNKMDQPPNYSVKMADIANLCEDQNLRYFETSSISGENIDDIFTYLATTIHEDPPIVLPSVDAITFSPKKKSKEVSAIEEFFSCCQ